jgi:hypothetical protein
VVEMSETREKTSRRGWWRAAGVTGAAAVSVLVASPTAQALMPDDGDDPGSGLSIFETLSLFVLTPILLFAVIAGLVVLAERRR